MSHSNRALTFVHFSSRREDLSGKPLAVKLFTSNSVFHYFRYVSSAILSVETFWRIEKRAYVLFLLEKKSCQFVLYFCEMAFLSTRNSRHASSRTSSSQVKQLLWKRFSRKCQVENETPALAGSCDTKAKNNRGIQETVAAAL